MAGTVGRLLSKFRRGLEAHQLSAPGLGAMRDPDQHSNANGNEAASSGPQWEGALRRSGGRRPRGVAGRGAPGAHPGRPFKMHARAALRWLCRHVHARCMQCAGPSSERRDINLEGIRTSVIMRVMCGMRAGCERDCGCEWGNSGVRPGILMAVWFLSAIAGPCGGYRYSHAA